MGRRSEGLDLRAGIRKNPRLASRLVRRSEGLDLGAGMPPGKKE